MSLSATANALFVSHTLQISLLSPEDLEYDRALHLALDAAWQPHRELASTVVDVQAAAQRVGFSLSPVHAVFDGRELLSAAVLLQSPGAAGLVFAPSTLSTPKKTEQATVLALSSLKKTTWDSSPIFLQALVSGPDPVLPKPLEQAGFTYLTKLLYLERPANTSPPEGSTPLQAKWKSYSPNNQGLFLRMLEESYKGTSDCSQLVGVRKTQDILAGHLATGEHDPRLWGVSLHNDEPSGILLLARLPARGWLEIVYVGVAQASRRQGVGDLLMHRAHTLCTQERAAGLTLAVDQANAPARAIYKKWSFTQVATRDVWFASPGGL